MSRELGFGTWPSPLSAADVAAGTRRLTDVCVDGDDIYWVEGRPSEGGRCVIVRERDGSCVDMIAAPFSARTGVHEYGGGAITAAAGSVYFSDGRHGQIFAVDGPDSTPQAVSTENPQLRFADFIVDAGRGRLIAVAEDHSAATVVNTIVAISLRDGSTTTLVSGADFYSSPRLSPDATQLAWVSWDFPQMPWDGTDLWRAGVSADGDLFGVAKIAGSTTESVVQPRWSPRGDLHCVSDRSGWWNVYRVEGTRLIDVAAMAMECARPHWNFGLSSYAFVDDSRIAIAAADAGCWKVVIADSKATTLVPVELPYTETGTYLHQVRGRLLLDGGGPTQPNGLHLLDVDDGAVTTVWRSSPLSLGAEWISTFERIEFPIPGGATGHAFLYPPRNPDVTGVAGERPPLLVRAHGGPTSAAKTSFALDVQYWTTRGFAVCDVNYGGSTGYGRAYRERLRGMTGCVDVDDCVAAARYLAEQGGCDAARLCITGGSAGGYIVLCALVFMPDVFAAATSYYGVADAEALAIDSHKFEARYYDSLIGPYPAAASLYHNRSPVHFAARIRTPLLVLQGVDDPVVPIAQADAMVAQLRANGTAHAYLTFAGEQHGFRRAESIVRALETELAFYTQVLGLRPAVPLPLVIDATL